MGRNFRIAAALVGINLRLDRWLEASLTVRLITRLLRVPARGRNAPPPAPRIDHIERLPAWLLQSYCFTRFARASSRAVSRFGRAAREGLWGSWWKACVDAWRAAPQRTLATFLLAGMAANMILVILTGTLVQVEGVLVRGVLLVFVLAAVVLKEGRLVGVRGESRPPVRRPSVSSGNFPLLAIGTVSGALWWFSPGTVFLGGVAAVGTGCLFRWCGEEDRRFLGFLFGGAFLLYAGVLAAAYVYALVQGRYYPIPQILDYGLRVPFMFGDGGYYVSRTWAASRLWQGGEVWPLAYIDVNTSYGDSAYLYLPTVYFYVFGAETLIGVRLINALIGAWVPVLGYLIARDLFGRAAARMSSPAIALFPSLIAWTLDLLKDVMFIASVMGVVWLWIRFRQGGGLFYCFGAVALSGFVVTLRYDLGVLLLLLSLGVLAHYGWTRWISGSPLRVLLIWVCIGAGLVGSWGSLSAVARETAFRLFNVQRGYASTPGRTTYSLWDDDFLRRTRPEAFFAEVTLSDIARALVKGQRYFWLEPIPGKGASPVDKLMALQMFFWYGVLILAARGIRRLRGRPELFVLGTFLGVFAFLIGMTSGNVGTLIRHRDLLTPIFLVLAGGGVAAWLSRPERLPD